MLKNINDRLKAIYLSGSWIPSLKWSFSLKAVVYCNIVSFAIFQLLFQKSSKLFDSLILNHSTFKSVNLTSEYYFFFICFFKTVHRFFVFPLNTRFLVLNFYNLLFQVDNFLHHFKFTPSV